MYHDNPNGPRTCVWCAEANESPLALCPRCEWRAQELKLRRGEPVRETQ